MASHLSDAQVRFFREHGYLSPVRAIDESEALACRRDLESFERETGVAAVELPHKPHLFFQWTWKLTRNPAVVGATQDLLGTTDIFVLASRFWVKEAGDRKFTGWHQDLAYFGLDPQQMITIWIAISPATRESGAMRFVPGTHTALRHHTETYNPDSLLSRGQYVADVDESDAFDAVLRPGEFSIHDGNLLHASPPNISQDRRIGLGLMLFPAHARSTTGRRSVTLLSGEDRHGHWDHDPLPTQDRDPVIWALMRAADTHYRDKSHIQAAELAK